ncbi:LysR family transcriptional regulator [Streptosporangium pseudovulgare]|uniref:LysR family transcriptional regulator n=1 Tax=Streptosporangium pseudovulgare TaxID=35765 RepID=A0ABQ2RAN0_9ACTN|nr:LysR family transcriptional regulator [Streptosporangium pseudovulgare]GGQ19604.1 LysR family transcriptional regulator [Streptosporangium pseudovulgare]
MERHEIETFLALAEELNFTRTAERLLVSPGRVSQTIKKLERRIGGPLFERSSRHVALTPVGRRLHAELLPAYRQVQQAVANASAAYRGLGGVLRAGFSALWCGDLIVRAAEVLQARHPQCTVEIHRMTFAAAFTGLRGDELDILVKELPVDGPDVIAGPVLFSERRSLVVPASHRLAARETVSLEDLALLPLITPVGASQDFLDAHYPRRTPGGRSVPQGPAAFGWEEMLSLVGAGKGGTPVGAMAADYHARPDIAYLSFDDAPPVDYAPMWLKGHESARLQTFVEILLELAPTR